MTDGFLTFPLKFPGTAVWRAMKGRQYIIKVGSLVDWLVECTTVKFSP
jgi:hypothetical protein